MEYITSHQAAERWGISLRWVQMYLKDGRIDGAVRFGRDWMIPKDAEQPKDGRVKSGKYVGASKKQKEQ